MQIVHDVGSYACGHVSSVVSASGLAIGACAEQESCRVLDVLKVSKALHKQSSVGLKTGWLRLRNSISFTKWVIR